MKIFNLISLFVLFSIITMVSCSEADSEDKKPVFDITNVLGYWEIHEATRNGKVTSTLVDSYMHFKNANEITTNIFGEDVTQVIGWNDNIAMVSDSSVAYNILGVNEDSLYLNFSLQRQLFQLTFFKQEGEVTIVD